VVAIGGGTPVPLADPGMAVTRFWIAADDVVFQSTAPPEFFQVPSAGGSPRSVSGPLPTDPLLTFEDVAFRGRRMFFRSNLEEPEAFELYLTFLAPPYRRAR